MKRLLSVGLVAIAILSAHGCGSTDRLWPREFPITGTYGDMFRHEPNGEILGIELRVVETAAGLQGTLQVGRGDQFGGLSSMVVVDVSVEDDRVTFTIPETHPYAGRFEGTRRRDAIVGLFKLLDGREEFVVLKRGESFWD